MFSCRRSNRIAEGHDAAVCAGVVVGAEGIENRARVESVGGTWGRAGREGVSGQAVGKISGPFRVGGNSRNEGIALAEAGSLVVAKDEGAVFPDRPAQEGSKLVAFERLLALVEIVDRIQLVVADEFISPAMHLVGAGFQDDVDGCAAAAELGAHRIFFGTKLLDGVGRRQHDHSAQSKFVVIHTVQQEIVVGDAKSIHRDCFVGALVFKHSATDIGSGLAAICTRAEICELNEIPAIQRKLGDAPLSLDGPQR